MINEDQWQRIVHRCGTRIELIGYHNNFEDIVKRALTQTIIMADSKPGCYDYEGEP